MKIILKSDVRDLGRSGELVEVKPGYARNYLLPKSLAVPATDGNVRDFNKRITAAKERDDRDRVVANALAERVRGMRITLIHRAVEGGTRLHGSVTTADVAQALEKLIGQEIDRRDLDLRQPIRALGEYQVNYKIMRGLTVPIKVLVAETEPVEEPEAVAEAAPVAEAAAVDAPAAKAPRAAKAAPAEEAAEVEEAAAPAKAPRAAKAAPAAEVAGDEDVDTAAAAPAAKATRTAKAAPAADAGAADEPAAAGESAPAEEPVPAED